MESFPGLCGLSAKFEWQDHLGKLLFFGDSDPIHGTVAFKVMEYLQACITKSLNTMPRCPEIMEDEIRQWQEEDPNLSRGQILFTMLFTQTGSVNRRVKVPVRTERCHSFDAEPMDGVKEADGPSVPLATATVEMLSCFVAHWFTTKSCLVGLEVAYKNESLQALGGETGVWALQNILAVGIKINGSTAAHVLDPEAILFIASPSPQGSGSLNLKKYTIGLGCGFPVDKNAFYCRSFKRKKSSREIVPLVAEIDWDGTAQHAHDSSRCLRLSYPPTDPDVLQSAFLAYMDDGVEDVENNAHASGITRELMDFINTLQISIDLVSIRALVLSSIYDQERVKSLAATGASIPPKRRFDALEKVLREEETKRASAGR